MRLRELLLVAALAATSTSIGACTKPDPSRQYLNTVTVDGYRKVGEGYGNAPYAYYIGPSNEDVKTAVHGPGGLQIVKGTLDLSNGFAQHVGSGEGAVDEKTRCQVQLFRLKPDNGTAPRAGDAKLSAADKAQVVDGTLFLLRISALC